MPDYAALSATASRLITASGRLVTLRKLSASPADVAKPWNGPGEQTVSTQVVNVPAVFVPPGNSNSLGLGVVDSELLKRAEQVALLSSPFEGLEEMNVMLDGTTSWKIEWVQVLKPADKTVLYVMGVTR